MASEIPPTYYFDNISFNPDFYQSSSDDYLTATTGKKIFLSFPYAQGTESIPKLYSSNIDTLTPTADFDFLDSATANINIGASVPFLKTIKLGANTNTTVQCGSIAFSGTAIDNAVDFLGGDLSLGAGQTTGILNLGTGFRGTSGSGGGINIGTLASGTIPITIGTTAKTTTTLRGTSVDVVTKLTTPKLDATADNTAMTIGSNITSGTLSIGGTAQTGNINLASGQTSGSLNIGTGARTSGSAINIGTVSATANVISIGSGTSSTVLNGTVVSVTTKITAPTIDSSAAGTDMFIGGNLNAGDLTIAGGQGTGDLFIGTSARKSQGDINIGTGANEANSLYIGHKGSTVSLQSVNINTSTGAGVGSTTIGSASSGTSILGTLSVTGNLTANGGITLPSGDELTITGTISGGGTITTTSSVASPAYNGPAGNATAMTFGGNQTSGDITVGGAQTSGDLYIGTGSRTAAADINIGTGTNLAGNIFIGHKPAVVSTQAVKINTSSATGASGATTIGSTTSATTIGGSLAVSGMLTADGGITIPIGDTLIVNGTLKSSSLDAVADTTAGTTALTIGSNVVLGNIEIGGALTTGDITIGKNNSTGAIITIGTESTSTTIKGGINFQLISENNGVLTTTTRIVNGKIGQIINPISTSPYTINADTINDRLVFVIQNPASGTINLPSTINLGQTITFRNTSTNAITISANGKSLVVPNSNTTVGSTVLAALGVVTYYGYASTIWLSIS